MTKKVLTILLSSVIGAITVGVVTTTIIISNNKTYIAAPNEDSTSFVYSGKEQTYQLAESEYYTISGNKQTDAGEYDVTVSLKEKGKCAWSTTKKSDDLVFKFTIDKKGILEPSNSTSLFEYTGEEITYTITSEDGSFYTVTNNKATNVGEYSAKVSLNDKKNYKWKTNNNSDDLSLPFAIGAKDISDLISIEDIQDMVYTGEQLKPEITLKTAIPSYDVTYGDNIEAGKGTVTITAKGNYKGSKTFEFNITGKTLEDSNVSNIAALTYTGSALTPDVVVTIGEKTLVKDTDYTIAYSNNTNAGTASVTVTGIGNYSGTVVKNFTINKKAPTLTAPTGVEGLRYTGESQELINAGSTTDGTLEYKIGDGDYSTDIPAKDARGTYTIYYRVKGNENIEDIAEALLTVTIHNPYATYDTEPTANNLTFDDTDQELVTAGTSTQGELRYSLSEDSDFSDSIPKEKLADTYRVYYMIHSTDSEYDDSLVSYIDVVIKKQKITFTTEPTAKNDLVYDGTEQTLLNDDGVASVDTTLGVIRYCLTETGYYFNPISKGTDAGSYDVWCFVESHNENYADSDKIKVTATIAARPITDAGVSIADVDDQTYTGSAITPNISATYSTMTLVKDTDYELSYENNTTVGTATITITGKGNYTGSTTKTFDITKADASFTTEPTAITGLIYDGQEHVLVNDGSTDDGTLKYSLIDSTDEADYSAELPKKRDAGNYTVYYMIFSDTNHNDSNRGSFVVGIAQKEIAVPTSLSEVNYDGTAQQPTIIDPNYVLNDNSFEATNAGNYDVVIKLIDTTNTKWAGLDTTTATVPWTINKISINDLTITGVPTSTLHTGSAIVINPTIKLGNLTLNNTDFTFTYTDSNNNEVTPINVGNNYHFIVSGGNFNGNKSFTFNIISNHEDINAATVTPDPIPDKEYTGSAITPNITVVVNSHTLVKDTDYELEYSNNTNIGEATITITGIGGYEGTKIVHFDIVARQVAIPAADTTSFVYTGSELTYTIAASDDYTVSNNVKTNAGEYTVTVTLNDTTHTTWSDGTTEAKEYEFNIAKMTPTVTAPTGKTGLTYTGSDIELLLTSGSTTAGTLKYKVNNGEYSTNLPVGNAQGSYTIYYKVDGDGNINNVAENSIVVTIGQAVATYTIVPAGIENIIYNGTEQTLITAGTSAQGDVVYSSTQGGPYTGTLPKSTNAGNYTVWYKIESTNSNYADSAEASLVVNIAQLSMTNNADIAIAAVSDQAYTGSAITPEPTVTFTGVNPAVVLTKNVDFTYGYSDNTNAGTNTARVLVNGTGNFTGQKSVSFTITQKTLVNPTIIIEQATYTGSNIVPTFTAYDGTFEISSDLIPDNATNRINVGTYTVTFHLKSGSNYGNTSDTFTVENGFTIVAKAYNADDFTIGDINDGNPLPYTGNPQTPDVSISYNNTILTKDTHYTLSYSDNTEVGTATMTITFTGNFTGSTTRTFEIASQTYTITYNVNGGSALSENTQTYHSDDTSVELKSTTRTGYTGKWSYSYGLLDFGASTTPTILKGNITLTAQWTAINYDVIYHIGNNATNNADNISTYTIETDSFTLKAPTYNDSNLATFVAWYDNENYTGNPVTTIAGGTTGEVNLYAKWNYTTFTITYSYVDVDGNTKTLIDDASVISTITNPAANKTTVDPSDNFSLSDPGRDYYVFGGWFNESTLDTTITQISNITANKTIYGKWTKRSYTITYVFKDEAGTTITSGVNNTNPATYKVNDGTTLVNPSLNQYGFDDWYSNAACTNSFTLDVAHPDNVTIYGKFIRHRTTFATYLNDAASNLPGTITSDITEKTVGQTVTITITKNTGFTFDGLYAGTTQVDDNDITDNHDGTYTATFTLTTTQVEYKAKFSGYNVTFSSENETRGTVSASVSNTAIDSGNYISIGSVITLTATTSNSYTFVGWFKDNTSYSTDLSTTYTMTNANVAFEARWIQVTVQSEDVTHGTVSTLNSTYKTGDQVSITATPVGENLFLGWFDGNTKKSGSLTYVFNMPSVDTTYEARFVVNNITVTHVEISNPDSDTISYNTSLAAPATPTIVANGSTLTYTMQPSNEYLFAGWYTNHTNYSTLISSDISYSCDVELTSQGKTIYALWVPSSLIVINIQPNVAALEVLATFGIVTDGITFEAQENQSYEWIEWYDNIGDEQKTATRSFTLNYADTFKTLVERQNFNGINLSYTAKWVLSGVIVQATTGGTVDEPVKSGNTWTINAVPNAGYTFDHWGYNNSNISSNAQETVSNSGTYIAYFTANTDTRYKIEYYLEDYDNGYGSKDGTLSSQPTGTTDTIAQITLAAPNNSAYEFDCAKIGETIVTPIEDKYNLTITGDGNATIKFYYKLKRINITYHKNDGNSVLVESNVKCDPSTQTYPLASYTSTLYTAPNNDAEWYTELSLLNKVTSLQSSAAANTELWAGYTVDDLESILDLSVNGSGANEYYCVDYIGTITPSTDIIIPHYINDKPVKKLKADNLVGETYNSFTKPINLTYIEYGTNAGSPITWIILDDNTGSYKLLSKDLFKIIEDNELVVEAVNYDSAHNANSYATSSISTILSNYVSGISTQLALLSEDELKDYNEKVDPNKVSLDLNDGIGWWLKDYDYVPEDDELWASYVDENGELMSVAGDARLDPFAIRPTTTIVL